VGQQEPAEDMIASPVVMFFKERDTIGFSGALLASRRLEALVSIAGDTRESFHSEDRQEQSFGTIVNRQLDVIQVFGSNLLTRRKPLTAYLPGEQRITRLR
jgi:hypothetical protein